MATNAAALADSPNCNGGPNGSQSIVVHLKKNTEDLQVAIMSARMGSMLAAEGCNVLLFLTLRGLRLADVRMPQNLTFGRDDVSPSPFTGWCCPESGDLYREGEFFCKCAL